MKIPLKFRLHISAPKDLSWLVRYISANYSFKRRGVETGTLPVYSFLLLMMIRKLGAMNIIKL